MSSGKAYSPTKDLFANRESIFREDLFLYSSIAPSFPGKLNSKHLPLARSIDGDDDDDVGRADKVRRAAAEDGGDPMRET